MDVVKIGEYISKLRRKKNMTQEELAKKLYVTNKAVSRWETGNSLPEIETLYLLSKELDVSVNEILEAGTSNNDEVKKYYNEQKNKKNILEIIITFIMYAVPIISIYICSICSLGVYTNVLSQNVEISQGIYQDAYKMAINFLKEYMSLYFFIPWIILLISYICYKFKKINIIYILNVINIIFFVILKIGNYDISLNIVTQLIVLIIGVTEIIILKKEK